MKNTIIAILVIIISFTYSNAQTISGNQVTTKTENPYTVKTSLGAMLLGKYKFVGEKFISANESIELEVGISGNRETLYYTEKRSGMFTSVRYKKFLPKVKQQGLYIAPGASLGSLDSRINGEHKQRVNFAAFIDGGLQFNIKSLVTDMFVGMGYSSNNHSGEITGTHTLLAKNLGVRFGFRTGLLLK